MKLLIADDHAIVREGLKQIISEIPEIDFIDEASDGFDVFNKLKHESFQMLLLDISMPGKSGLDVLKEVKDIYPNLPVLVLSVHSEEQYAKRVLRAGASGFIPKHADPDELKRAIIKVMQGRKYISNHFAEILADEIGRTENEDSYETLSDREFQVFKLLAKGYSNKEISERLFLSDKTVSTYKARIFEKMNISNNAELIKYAIEHNLLEE